MRGGSLTRYEMPALLLVSLVSILALSPTVAPLRSWLLGDLPVPSNRFSWSELWGAYLASIALTLVTQRTIDYYLLLEKREHGLSRALSILILFALLLRLPWQLWWLPFGFVVAAATIFGAYQMRGRASQFLLLGLGLGGLSLYSAKVLLLLPLLWTMMYQQRTLHFKHFLASVHGVLLTAFGAFAVLGVERSLELAQRWLVQWSEWNISPWGMQGYGAYSWLAFGGLSALTIGLVAYISGISFSSVRHLVQQQSLTSMLFLALGLWAFDASTPTLFAVLAHLPFVVLLTKGIALLPRLRYQRWGTISLMVVLFLILFLS